LRVIAYETEIRDGKLVLAESTGESCRCKTLTEVFEFLFEEYGSAMRVCWDLDATVSPILRMLGERSCRILKENLKLRMPPFTIFYVPEKVFSVTHIPTRRTVALYNLSQYYPDIPVEPIDVYEVESLAYYLLETLKKMGMTPSKLTSPVAIYDECVLSHLDLPKLPDMPKEAAEYAWECAGELWIEAFKLGYFELAYDYDIKSAFPSVAKELRDWRGCAKWVKDKTYREDAIYGYCRGRVTIKDSVNVSPIIYVDEHGESSSPVGTWRRTLPKSAIDFIAKWGIGSFEIEDGWWCIPYNKKVKKPLEVVVDRLLRFKEGNELQKTLAKRMAVGGFYGKFGEERKDGFGPHFNPCWFAEISTAVRLEVADFIYRHGLEDAVIHVSVDGVLSEREVAVKSRPGGLQWRLSEVTPALVISSGLVYMGTKKPKGLMLNEVLEMIREHPNQGYYEKKIVRRVTLGDALSQNKFSDLGKPRPMYTAIDLHRQEHDRVFKRLPQTGGQLLKRKFTSKPKVVKE